MLWRYSASVVAYCYFRIRAPYRNRYLNCAAVRRETQCIINEVAHGATEQNGVAINFAFAGAIDGNMSIFRERAIKRCDLFHRSATIKLFSLDGFAGRIDARDEEQIIDDSRQPFALGNRGFDNFAIFLGAAIARQSNLRFAEDIGNWRAEFVGQVGGKLGESRKGSLE